MKRISIAIAKALALLAFFAALPACEEPFDPPSVIQSRRVLAITADPLEAAPGETFAFRAVVANGDGSLYDGPVVWAIAGGDALRLAGDLAAAEEPVRLAASEPFFWTAPDAGDLAARYGEFESRGLLLTAGATAFESANIFSGQVAGAPIPAFKLLVVSDRAPDERFRNPVLAEIVVRGPGGVPLTPGDDGVYATDARKVILEARAASTTGRLSYHWFATDDGFEPRDKSTHALSPGRTGLVHVWCVIRATHFFDHDDGTRTRVAGIDWKRVAVRFE
ncbi:hypothetical protein K8I61_19140 [bacterium]|nr:hypothetical protein [bacterium]